MKVATLFVDKVLEAMVLRTLSCAGIEAASFASLASLLASSTEDAVVTQDDERWRFEWLSALCSRPGRSIPVFVVGASFKTDVAEALLLGAVDHLMHDEVPRKLVARLQARVNSSNNVSTGVLTVRKHCLSERSSTLWCGEHSVRLTPREFALAWVLFSHAGRVVSLQTLAARVWGRPSDVCKRTLEQHIYRLRSKLARGAEPLRIKAIYNIGYRLELPDEEPVVRKAQIEEPMAEELQDLCV